MEEPIRMLEVNTIRNTISQYVYHELYDSSKSYVNLEEETKVKDDNIDLLEALLMKE